MRAETRPGLLHHSASARPHAHARHRVLSACVGLSITLHVAVLFAFPGLRPSASAGTSRPLTATFAPAPVRPETPAAVPKRLSRSRGELNPVTPQPIPAVSEPAAVAARFAEPTALSAPGPRTAAAAPAVTETSGAREALAIPAESIEKYSAGAVDADLLEKYRLALIDAAKRYKRYPGRAVENGWQGRVEVRLVVGSDGTLKNAVIKKSSSHRILDAQALDMVKKSTWAEPIPSALRGREFTLDIPVIFELQAG